MVYGMKVLAIGSGGREHALVWKLAQSPQVTALFCAPGNAGIQRHARCVPIAATDTDKLVEFASYNRIDLTVVGPEAPLCVGLADAFIANGLKTFGPTKRAAQIEASKAFTKRFLLKNGVPTAAAEVFENAQTARAFVRKMGAPIVVKADGLAAGKGVVVAQTLAEAERAIGDLMQRRIHGEAGARVIIEECLRGEEVSAMALVDGKTFKLLDAAQDYKRVGDGDTGPNTGGMGACSPAGMDAVTMLRIEEIFRRTLAGLAAEHIEYRGVLYAGLMLTAGGPKVLEFNCRFGDPETQVLAPRMDFDLVDALLATCEGRLDAFQLNWKRQAAVCVVMASHGYPGPHERGKRIEGLQAADALDNVTVFHAGTKRDASGAIVTDGGRVLGVTALGDDIAAERRAYEAVAQIRFDGAHYRRDIAARKSGTAANGTE